MEIEMLIKELAVELDNLGGRFKGIDPDSIYFDDSRAWSLYVDGYSIGLPVNKFGAFRNYLGGGVRGGIEHNGRTQDGTVEAGELFKKYLLAIENVINGEYNNEEPWENSTGVLLDEPVKAY